MAEGLQYKIGADVKDFQAGVSKVVQGLGKLETESKKTFTAVSKGAANAAPALNSLGQVARDLPFGFIAIQNNLPIVIDQFSNLAKTSGGAGAAFKALAGSLIGPAGIAFAFGVVIAGVTSLIQKYGSLQNAVDALFFSTDQYAQSKKNLADIGKEANKSASEEIAKLTVLNAVATDTTNSIDNRKEAANKLLKVYKEYLPNLTQEAILNNEAADAINRAKDAIINKALAIASEKKLAEIGEKILDVELRRIDEADRYNRLAKQKADIESKSQKDQITGAPKLNTQVSTQVGLLNDVKNEISGIDKELEVLKGQFNDVTNLAKGFAKAAGDGFIDDVKPPKVELPVFIRPNFAQIDKGTLLEQAEKEIARNFNRDALGGIEIPLNITIPEKAKKDLAEFGDTELAKLQNKLDKVKEFSDALTAQLQSSFGDVFTSIGEGIGNVFSGVANGFSIAQTVLSGLADVLINVGKLAISTGIAILGIKKALQTLNPAVAIAGGVALVALGTAVKGKLAASVPKFAEGGIVNRPTMGMFGEAGPEAVIPLDKLNSMLSNFGGGNNLQIAGQFQLRGNDLYASVYKTGVRQGRVI